MRTVWSISFVAVSLAGPALAQQGSPYEAGLRVAQGCGYANADCYARVFAKHAVVREKANGGLGWYAVSTPAYNAEQRSRCGIDRLEDLAARREAPRSRGSVHRAGMGVAAQRGYSGSEASCFARVHATYAAPRPAERGRVNYAIPARSANAYSQELFQRCGISR